MKQSTQPAKIRLGSILELFLGFCFWSVLSTEVNASGCADAAKKAVSMQEMAELVLSYDLQASGQDLLNKALRVALDDSALAVFQSDPIFTQALFYRFSGYDEQAESLIKSFNPKNEHGEPLFGLAKRTQLIMTAKDMIVHLSKDRDVRRALVRMFAPVEPVMGMTYFQTDTKIVRYGQERPLFDFRPQQFELTRLVIQYAPQAKDENANFLEVGYGAPAVLNALRKIVKQGNIVGVDVDPIVRTFTDELNGIDLYRASIPEDKLATRTVSKKGPFNAIFASDVWKPRLGFGSQFQPGTSNDDYLKWVHQNLTEGGVMIILNDFGHKTIFTQEEAKKAGFEIVRWEEPDPLSNKEREMMPEGAGVMVYYVLRKGKPTQTAIDYRKVDVSKEDQKPTRDSPNIFRLKEIGLGNKLKLNQLKKEIANVLDDKPEIAKDFQDSEKLLFALRAQISGVDDAKAIAGQVFGVWRPGQVFKLSSSQAYVDAMTMLAGNFEIQRLAESLPSNFFLPPDIAHFLPLEEAEQRKIKDALISMANLSTAKKGYEILKAIGPSVAPYLKRVLFSSPDSNAILKFYMLKLLREFKEPNITAGTLLDTSAILILEQMSDPSPENLLAWYKEMRGEDYVHLQSVSMRRSALITFVASEVARVPEYKKILEAAVDDPEPAIHETVKNDLANLKP